MPHSQTGFQITVNLYSLLYNALSEVGEDEASDPFHFALLLIREIIRTSRQELATHTFSHFYCLEEGQTKDDFKADIEAAARIGSAFDNVCRSIVFPRNQFNPAYLDFLRHLGVKAYRCLGAHRAQEKLTATACIPAA